MTGLTLVLVSTLAVLLTSISAQRSQHAVYTNCLHEGEPIRIHISLANASQLLHEQNISMIYSLAQPDESIRVNLSTYQHMDNLTLAASVWTQGSSRPLSTSTRNITRYAKIRNAAAESQMLAMDIGAPGDAHNDTDAQYDLHLPVRYSLLVLYADQAIPANSPHFSLFGFVRTRHQSGHTCYAIPVDQSQMHVPMKTYKPVSRVENGSHEVLFTFRVYYQTYYEMFYGITNKQFIAQHNPLMADIYDDAMIDFIKQFIFDNNLYMVLLYFALSTVQVFMQIFAFKEEIKIWKQIEKHAGLSIKSLYQTLACEIIICLYLYNKQASKLYLYMQVANLVMTLWKLTKAIDVSVSRRNKFIVKIGYKQWYHRKVESSDTEAIHYTSYLIAVMYVCFMVYKLYSPAVQFYTHYAEQQQFIVPSLKQAYSFMLESSVLFIFVFGFVMMTPQLYINYKLKSVDHLPWKTLIYRFINTIIDDIFVLMVDLPLLQRAMSFRDDIIFILYLVQRRLYRVDKNRIALSSGSIDQSALNKVQPALKQKKTQ